jgi:homoserine kinase
MSPNSVTVRVPASTSNLGSGFDTLGLAVRLYNQVHVTRRERGKIELDKSVRPEDRGWVQDVAESAMDIFFRRSRVRSFGASIGLSGEVPVARGLGASATARVGILAALNALAGDRFSREQLLDLATTLEGHPDNASPALFGGFTVSGNVQSGRKVTVRCLSYRVSPQLKLVTLIPRYGINTHEARRLLPKAYPKADAAHALNRSALITAALSSRRYGALRGLFDDRVHQPYREQLLPSLTAVIRAGEAAGALGGFLSGSGSSIICLTLASPGAIGRAMLRSWPEGEVKILTADNRGIRVKYL